MPMPTEGVNVAPVSTPPPNAKDRPANTANAGPGPNLAQSSSLSVVSTGTTTTSSSSPPDGAADIVGADRSSSSLLAHHGNNVQDCDAALDALDSCVACAEGVDLQTEYEAEQQQRQVAAAGLDVAGIAGAGQSAVDLLSDDGVGMATEDSLHGLTEEEVALVRLQAMEREEELRKVGRGGAAPVGAKSDGNNKVNVAAGSSSEEGVFGRMMDDMNLCGNDLMEDAAEVLRAQSHADVRSAASDGSSVAGGATGTKAGTSASSTSESANATSSVSAAASSGGSPSAPSAAGDDEGFPTAGGDPSSPADSSSDSPDGARGVSSSSSSSSHPLQCAICFGEASLNPPSSPASADVSVGNGSSTDNAVAPSLTFAYLPCCGSGGREATSTTKVCTACILLLSTPTSDGTARIGRCPRCRSWISVTTEGSASGGGGMEESTTATTRTGPPSPASTSTVVVRAVTSAGKCTVCNQTKSHLVDGNNNDPSSSASICDACYLGRRRPLIYECEQCHGAQRIPHPMYRYQPAVDDFGKTSWACHGRCQNFTMWRIVPSQVTLVPPGDAPESWGEDYLEVARVRVREARRGIVAWGGEAAAAAPGNEAGNDGGYGCTVC